MMTPEERAMALLYEGYVPDTAPIVHDEVLKALNLIGNYTDRVLKGDTKDLSDAQRENIRKITKFTGQLYRMWHKKPPLTSLQSVHKQRLFELLKVPLSEVITCTTLVLTDVTGTLTTKQETYIQTINEISYQIRDEFKMLDS